MWLRALPPTRDVTPSVKYFLRCSSVNVEVVGRARTWYPPGESSSASHVTCRKLAVPDGAETAAPATLVASNILTGILSLSDQERPGSEKVVLMFSAVAEVAMRKVFFVVPLPISSTRSCSHPGTLEPPSCTTSRLVAV